MNKYRKTRSDRQKTRSRLYQESKILREVDRAFKVFTGWYKHG